MKRLILLINCLITCVMLQADGVPPFPQVVETAQQGYFPLVSATTAADICVDAKDYRVVTITAGMLADDVLRVTGKSAKVLKTKSLKEISRPAVVVGTLGHSALIDQLVSLCQIKTEGLRGKWESFMLVTVEHPKTHVPILLVIGLVTVVGRHSD